MTFLLEVDACQAFLKGRRRVTSRFAQYAGGLFVSAVTILELELWLLHGTTPSRHQFGYGLLRQGVNILSADDGVAHAAALAGVRQARQGRRMRLTDLLIAATATVHSLTLVTHGPQAFANFPGLTIVDWLAP